MSDATPILMPQLGNTMEEGTIVKWLVREGDRVKAGDVLFEVETDKATIEVEAETEGRIAKIVVGDGGTVAVKSPVAFFGEGAVAEPSPATATPEPQSVATTPAPATTPTKPEEPREGRLKASPAARRAAEVLGVALESVAQGSGPDGRILREDVEAFASQKPQPPAPTLDRREGDG
jgi:pyruvate dehydrogenase E2 component (dihydrolipoamide acetyltransferase)